LRLALIAGQAAPASPEVALGFAASADRDLFLPRLLTVC
jgi:hypothetical protein